MQTSPLCLQYPYANITPMQTSPLCKHHPYANITPMQTLPLCKHYPYANITPMQTLPLCKHHPYANIFMSAICENPPRNFPKNFPQPCQTSRCYKLIMNMFCLVAFFFSPRTHREPTAKLSTKLSPNRPRNFPPIITKSPAKLP
jgi:hypothetical protein